MEGSTNLKSKSCDPEHATLEVIHHPLCSTRQAYLTKKKEMSSFTRSKVTENPEI